MSRINLKSITQPHYFRWELALTGDYMSHCYPEAEFFISEHGTHTNIGHIELKELVLLQYLALKSYVTSCDGMFVLDERYYAGIMHSIYSYFEAVGLKDLGFDELSEDKKVPKFALGKAQTWDGAMAIYSSLSLKEKLAAFELEYPEHAKYWKSAKGKGNLKHRTDDEMVHLFNKYHYHWTKYDSYRLSQIFDIVDESLSKTKFRQTATWKAVSKYEGQFIYVLDDVYPSVSKRTERAISRRNRRAWHQFKWWEKHVLFNENSDANFDAISMYGADWKSDYEKRRSRQLSYGTLTPHHGALKDMTFKKWLRVIFNVKPNAFKQRMLPCTSVEGYVDGYGSLSSTLPKMLTAHALYQFYFGHICYEARRKIIRECWKARKMLYDATNYYENSFYEESQRATKEFEKANGIKIVRFNYALKDTIFNMTEMKEVLLAYDTGSLLNLHYLQKLGSPFNEKTGAQLKKEYDTLFVVDDDEIPDDKVLYELNDKMAGDLKALDSKYMRAHYDECNEKSHALFKAAFNYISDNFYEWSD